MIPDWADERKRMVDEQLRRRGVTDERVLAAMSGIPREEFVPHEARILSYRDDPVGIGFGQTPSEFCSVADWILPLLLPPRGRSPSDPAKSSICGLTRSYTSH